MTFFRLWALSYYALRTGYDNAAHCDVPFDSDTYILTYMSTKIKLKKKKIKRKLIPMHIYDRGIS